MTGLDRAVVQAVLLHGSPGTIPLDRLEPRRSQDADKATGNLTAVYATRLVVVALLHATLDKAALTERFGSCSIRYRAGPSGLSLTLRAGRAPVEPLWTDGRLYVLSPGSFRPAQTGPDCSEYYSLEPAVPLEAVAVPAALGRSTWQDGLTAG